MPRLLSHRLTIYFLSHLMSNFALTQEGAIKLHAYLEEMPLLKDTLGTSFQVASSTLLKDTCELPVAAVNEALGTQFQSGKEAHDAIGDPIALGFNDYGSHSVSIDLRALYAVSIGTQPRSRQSELVR